MQYFGEVWLKNLLMNGWATKPGKWWPSISRHCQQKLSKKWAAWQSIGS